MKFLAVVVRRVSVAALLVMHSNVWASNTGLLTTRNRTALSLSVSTTGGGYFGGALMTAGLTVSGGIPINGVQRYTVTVSQGYSQIATCAATVDTNLPILVDISAAQSVVSCTVENSGQLTPVLNTTMGNYTTSPVVIVQNLLQDGVAVGSTSRFLPTNATKVAACNVPKTTPITANQQVFSMRGKLLATCSATVAFNTNLFYTTVKVLPDTSQPSGYTCTAW